MGNKELEMAMRAAYAGGSEIMKIYNSDVFGVEHKEDKSPLTIADKKANDIILSSLEKTGIPIISEEIKEMPYETRKEWKKCWIVDPLDGTKEFIKKNGEFTVNIALILEGKPVLGVIFIPVTKMMYFADVKKKFCYKLKVENEDALENAPLGAEKIKTSSIGENIRIVGSRSHMNDKTLSFIEALKKDFKKEVAIVSRGSSLKFCLVAEGLADVYPRFAPTMEWDTAAGQAVCEAVGLQVIDQETSAPLVYNRKNLVNNYFLVSNLG